MTRPAPTTSPPRLDLTLQHLSDGKDVVLCDVWGVIHNGVERDPGAVAALQQFRKRGGTVVLVTNAPVPAIRVKNRMDSLGVSADAYDAIVTAGDVAVEAILEAGCPRCFAIGATEGSFILDECERVSGRATRLVPLAEAELVVCFGLDATGSSPADYDQLLKAARQRDLPMICANPDIVVEVGDQLEYCAGAIAERYSAIGGRVLQTGKPFPAIYARALALIGRPDDLDAARILAIGDGAMTDLKGAAGRGYPALFITSGIHRGTIHADGGPIDPAALDALLAATGAVAFAALPRLRW